MPTGRVRFYDAERGFGFISQDGGGDDVFLPRAVLPEGAEPRKGAKVEFGIADGRRGPQALSVTLLDKPAEVRQHRRPAEDMASMVEDMIKVMETVQRDLRRGRWPERDARSRVARVVRAVADELDA